MREFLPNNVGTLIDKFGKLYPEANLLELKKLAVSDYEKFFLLVGVMCQYKDEFSNEEINILRNKIMLLESEKCEYLNAILGQIASLTYQGLDKLIDCILRASEIDTSEYIKDEYDRIFAYWKGTEKGKYFDIPSGIISVSIDGDIINTLVGENSKEDSLYDVASMTKLYTEVLLFRIIDSGDYEITLDTKINTLTDKYPYLPDDFKIRDLIEFQNNYRTTRNIKNAKSINDAKECLRTCRVLEVVRGEYLYTDLPIMILTDVLELTTGKDYKRLLTEYVLWPFNLRDTYLGKLGQEEIGRYTGRYPDGVNDPKANYMGGYYGHAGIKTTSSDWIKFANAVLNDKMMMNSEILFELFGMGEARYSGYDLQGLKVINYPENKILDQELRKIGYNLGMVTDLIKENNNAKLMDLINEIKEDRSSFKDNGFLIVTLDKYMDFVKNIDKHLLMEGSSKMGNFNTAAEHIMYGDVSMGSLSSDTISYMGGEVQGSTRVHGGMCKYRVNGVDYITSVGIFIDIVNQIENAKNYDENSGKTKTVLEYKTKELGSFTSFDPRSIIPYNGVFGELKDMVGRARILEMYKKIYNKEYNHKR